jgi:signal transduction histidine kinase
MEKFDSYPRNKTKHMIEMMDHTTKQTYDLLQNLLQWSQAQSGRIENKPVKVDLKEIVVNNIMLLKNNILEKNIKTENSIPDNLFVYVDYNMINTVFRNLISNAIKFTQKGGCINIVLEQQTGDAEPKNEFVIASVNDTGVGINKGNIKKLFRIEENLTTKGTNNEKGTGLGLMLCKEFIEIMGGEIWVESEVGKGSSFFIKIPLCTD